MGLAWRSTPCPPSASDGNSCLSHRDWKWIQAPRSLLHVYSTERISTGSWHNLTFFTQIVGSPMQSWRGTDFSGKGPNSQAQTPAPPMCLVHQSEEGSAAAPRRGSGEKFPSSAEPRGAGGWRQLRDAAMCLGIGGGGGGGWVGERRGERAVGPERRVRLMLRFCHRGCSLCAAAPCGFACRIQQAISTFKYLLCV